MKVDDEVSLLSKECMVDDSESWSGDGGEDMRMCCLRFRDEMEIYNGCETPFFL